MTLAFITSTNSPFCLAQSKQFKDLIDYVSNSKANIPSNKTLMSDLDKNYTEAKAKLKVLIDKSKYVCITADVWTNKARSFLGISVHFFNEVLQRKSFLLAFRRIKGRHTYAVLAEAILGVQKEFNIKRQKITHIVTDGASNFRKAFVIYGEASDEEEVEIEQLLGPETDENTVYYPPETMAEVLTLNDPELTEEDDDECYDFTTLPKQLRCLAHALNLIGTTDFEKLLKSSSIKCYESLNSGYSKLKRFWEVNSRSTVAHEIIERVCKRSFPYPNTTRWNSKFDSITIAEKHRLLIKEAIDEINKEVGLHSTNRKKAKNLEQPTVVEWKLLKDYSTALKPVAIALDILQGDKRACQGYVLPTLYGIQASLEENLNDRLFVSDYGIIMNECVQNSLSQRFKAMMEFNDENKDLILAAAIHPNFKITWITNETDREYAQALLINTYIKLANTQNAQTSPSTSQESRCDDDSTESRFFQRLRHNERRTSGDDTLTFDVWKFLLQSTEDHDLTQVRGIPILDELFRQYNTTLSSSASIERIFSKALSIFTPKRNRISDQNFEKALFIQQNRELLSS